MRVREARVQWKGMPWVGEEWKGGVPLHLASPQSPELHAYTPRQRTPRTLPPLHASLTPIHPHPPSAGHSSSPHHPHPSPPPPASGPLQALASSAAGPWGYIGKWRAGHLGAGAVAVPGSRSCCRGGLPGRGWVPGRQGWAPHMLSWDRDQQPRKVATHLAQQCWSQ